MRERKIIKTREFMKSFLTTDIWDEWFLTEAQIVCANTISIDGRINQAYFEGNDDFAAVPESEFSLWADIRPIAFTLIKGKRTPVSFKFILVPHDKIGQDVPTDLKRVCRIRFTDGHVYIASAVSMNTFSLDKEPERSWDTALSRFLSDNSIDFEEF